MRVILREVAKCRALLGQIVEALKVLPQINGRLDSIDKTLAEIAEGPDQSSVSIIIGPVSEQSTP